MKTIVSIIVFGFFSISLSSQNITGKVIDKQNQPIEFANVALYSLPDSTLITGTVTNANGEFTFENVATKNGFLQISFMGYETRTVPATSGQTIVMKDDSQLLGEVVISGTRKAFQMQNGNIVANVSGTVLAKEVSAMEVLRKIPGMALKDGHLSSFIGGKPIIYINGKKVKSMDEVQQLEVKNIKSVELNTNPGAEYDASAGAVLLITTHKRIEGLAVQVESMLQRNRDWSHNNSLKMNYKQEKLSIFGQIGYADMRRKNEQDVTTIIYAPDTTWQSNAYLKDLYNSNTYLSYSLGIEYDISKKHNIGLKYDGSANTYNSHNQQPLTLLANQDIFSEIKGESTNKNKGNSHYLNAYYQGSLTEKLQMEIFADYLKKHGTDNQIVSEKSALYGDSQTHIHTQSDNNLFAVTPKFSYIINSKNQISAGIEYSTVVAKTKLMYEPKTINDKQSETSENKAAAYMGYSFNNQNGFSASVGLRYEFVKARFDDKIDDKNDINRTYSDFFPNIRLSYQKGLLSQNLGYRSGISRPDYGQLNGNTFYVNQFMYQEGNPLLIPEISHSVQYSLMYRFIYFALQYQYFKNTIQNDFQTPTPTSNVVKNTFRNYDNAQQIQAVLNLRHTFGFYTPSLTVAYMQNFMDVATDKGVRHINKPFGYINFNNDFDLSSGFLFNAEYIYTGRGTAGFLYFEPTHVFNARIQKTFLKNSLQVSLTAKDVFGKQIGRFGGQVNHIYMSNVNRQDQRSISLNVVWRFNNHKKSYKGEAASQDEINRLK